MSTFIRWFSDLSMADVAEVGGKCASLGELTRAGIRVPDGFALTTAAYERHRASGGMPDDVYADLAAAYARLSGDRREASLAVAVRSSAVGEDSAEASFAGQQETYLWRRGLDDVVGHVLRCWDSLYTPQAQAYRAHLGPRADEPTMSVAVQRMVDARVAGILFTISPATGDRSVVAINASWGLGLGVVGGEITPDEYWVDKVSLTVRRRTIVDKPREFRPDMLSGGTVEVATTVDRRTQPCLTDDEVVELARLGKRIEQHYGGPQDIEWAIDDAIWILQSRPETVWSRQQAPLSRSAGSPLDLVLRTMRGNAGPPRSSA